MRKLVLAFAMATSLVAANAVAAPIMYVHDSDGSLGTVDVATGTVVPIGQMGAVMTDIAFDPAGNLFGITFDQLFSINPDTAASSLIGVHEIPGGNALVFGTDGTLYGAGFASTQLFTVNPANGATSAVGNMGFASGGDLAFNAASFYLASGTSQLVSVNPATGAGALVGSFGVGGVFGLATGENGILYAVASTTVYTVNTATGAASNPVSFAGSTLGQAFGQSFFQEAGAPPPDPDPVPEPGTLALLACGLAGGLLRGRRARNRTSER